MNCSHFMLHDIEESIGGDGFEDEQIQASSVEGSVGRQTPSSLQPSSRVQTQSTQLNRQTPSIEDSTESGPVIATTSAGSTASIEKEEEEGYKNG